MTKKKSIITDQRFIVLLVIIALVVIYMIFSPEFRQYSSILSMLDFSYYDILMAIGVTFPLITAGVDLSIGTGMVCYALVAGRLVRDYNCPVLVAMLICVLFGAVVGLANGTLIGVMGLPPFLATLCTCMITRGISSMVMATPWPTNKQPGGWFHSIFKLTFGTGTIAIGSNKEALMLSGVNVKIYHVMAYVVCGIFAGLAAIVYAADVPTVQPGTGAGLELDAIGGVFVGGVSATGGYGSVIGTRVGAFVIVLLKTGLPYVGLQANWQQIITGIVLIGAVMIDVAKRRRMAKEQ